MLSEFLDINITAKYVTQCASSAPRLIIAKYKAFDNMPYNVFTKLYDSTVLSVISYGGHSLRQ